MEVDRSEHRLATSETSPKRTIFQAAKRRVHQLLKIKKPLVVVHHRYSPEGLDKRIRSRDPRENHKRILENQKDPAPRQPIARPFSFVPGQDVVDSIAQVVEADRPSSTIPEKEPLALEGRHDGEYSDSDYDEDRPTSDEIRDQFGSSNELRTDIRRYSSSRPPSMCHRDAACTEVPRGLGDASRPLSTTTKHCSVFWANLYSNPEGENPFQNAHPIREGKWKETELTLLGMGPSPTRGSAIPPVEMLAAIFGPRGSAEDEGNSTLGPDEYDGKTYFPPYGEIYNANSSPKPSRSRVVLKKEMNRNHKLQASEGGRSPDERGIPRSETENSTFSEVESSKILRFYSTDGIIYHEIALGGKGQPPLGVEANLSPRSFAKQLNPISPFPESWAGNLPSSMHGFTKATMVDKSPQWSPARERAATDTPMPSCNMVVEPEEAGSLTRSDISRSACGAEVVVDSPPAHWNVSENHRISQSAITNNFCSERNSPESSVEATTHRMDGDRVLRRERRHIGETPDFELLQSSLIENQETIVPESKSALQQTPEKEHSLAATSTSPHHLSAPALLPPIHSLEEHIKYVEKILGYWDGTFERAEHPEVYESCYCGFLTNPERTHRIHTALDLRVEVLERSAAPPYTMGPDEKLVCGSRAQLLSKYMTRPKETLSFSSNDTISPKNNKFVPKPGSTDNEPEGYEWMYEESEEEPESFGLNYWERYRNLTIDKNINMDGSPDQQGHSNQSASHTVDQQSASITSSMGGQTQNGDVVSKNTRAQTQSRPSLATSQNQVSMDPQALSPDSELKDMLQCTLTLSSRLEAQASEQTPIVVAVPRISTSQRQSVAATSMSTPRPEALAAAAVVSIPQIPALPAQTPRDSLEYQARSVAHPFDRSLPPGAADGTPVGHGRGYSRSNAVYPNQAARGPIFNPHRVSYQRGEVNVPTHGNLTSGHSGHLPRRGSGSGRSFAGGTGMQPLILSTRVSVGMSVTDANDQRPSLGLRRTTIDSLMRHNSARIGGTGVPRVFPAGTPMQPLLLVDRVNEQRHLGSERVVSDERCENRSERSVVDVGVEAAAGSERVGPAPKPEPEPQGLAHRSEGATRMHGGLAAESDVAPSQTPTPTPTPTPTQTPLQPSSISVNVTTSTATATATAPLADNPAFPSFPPRRSSLHRLTDQESESFLAERLASEEKQPIADMDKLQVRSTEFSTAKTKAIEDARQMQARVIEECTKNGKDPPPYGLVELIGKGSFGRVYMGKDMKSAAIVAIKIIDIDESDTLNPRNADSYTEFLKEVNALKILSENKAKNINHVIEALPVNQAMWMIIEYCGGGSVATLMKPSAPAGLMEKWIIPILREVAEALKWVHQAGIIHRDIKCANVLITEQGGVQLCDFGVAGIVENKLDKRSTIIGTPHWMAPELFNDTPSYGKEVDIWAFGAMTYEIATGLPPNVANGIPWERLGSHLKKNVPRLEGGDYSNELRDIVAFLLEEVPSARPTIEQVQKHKYIANTSSTYPTTNLRSLVGSFRMWESRGGDRKSLFMQHGAQGPSNSTSGQDEWNFSTTEVFDKSVEEEFSAQDVFDAYGPSINFDEATARPNQRQPPKGSRRRPPPEALARMPAPLEKIFDPNTMSNYEENSRVHYGKAMMSGPSTSDLPLRDDSAQTSIKDNMIDLGGHDSETGLSSFPPTDTIKAGRRQDESEDQYNSTLHDFSRPALSDPADINTNRRTQDWKFPSMAPPASADPELSRFPPSSFELPRPAATAGSGGRPTLVHHPTEPLGVFGGGLMGPTQSAMDRMSLIDLDMSLPDTMSEFRRPSTANSDVSATSEQMTSGNPFELERHTSQLYHPAVEHGSDPAIYVTEESSVSTRIRTGNPLQDIADMSDFSASDVEGPQANGRARHMPQFDGTDDSDYRAMPPPPLPKQSESQTFSGQPYTMAHFPPLPEHPSVAALTGTASMAEMQDEIKRALSGLSGQLSAFKDVYSTFEAVSKRGSGTAGKIQE